MKRFLLISGVFLLSAATGQIRAAPEPIALFEGAGQTDVVPTAAGYAAVWLEAATNLASFTLLDPSGVPTGPPVPIGDLGIDRIFQIEMEAGEAGFVVYASGLFTGVRSLPIDASGAVSGPVRTVVPPGDVLDWEVAADGSSHLVAYGIADIVVFQTLSQRVGFDGAAIGAPERLDAVLAGSPTGFLEAVRVSVAKGGWITAWSDLNTGVNARPVRKNGTPVGKASDTIAGADRCGRWVTPFATKSGSGTVYGAGCGALFPEFRQIVPRGVEPAIPLDTGGYGPLWSFGTNPLDAAGTGERFGLVLDTPPPTSDPVDPGTWIYAEFDVDGNRLGPVLDLRATYGVVATDVRIFHDPHRNRYVLSWVGQGPAGEGAYTLLVAPI